MTLKKLKRPDPSNIPTTDNPADYTGDEAPERTLLINLGFIKYGTNDRTQGSAVLFSFLLLILIALLVLLGILNQDSTEVVKESLSWLKGVFTLIIGVAIGKVLPSKNSMS
jgi:hypothetical protein